MNIFIGGPRSITKLDELAVLRLRNIRNKNFNVLVGDCSGIDKSVQQFFLGYENVTVYASNGIARNNIGKWPVASIEVSKGVSGRAFYEAKDIAMTQDCDYGFMIWNGESKGTLGNIKRLSKLKKVALVFLAPERKFVAVRDEASLADLLGRAAKPRR
ncbi:MAG: hypothetical protein LBT59_11525 [Clostridiales bacterium]|jgi:hypothetical protein|nr:hypothetical protein [Clostridiales bacterium]